MFLPTTRPTALRSGSAPRRSVTGYVLTLVMLAIVVSGCSSGTSTAGATDPSNPAGSTGSTSGSTPGSTTAPVTTVPPIPPSAPPVNTCHQLTYSSTSLYSDGSATVPCSKPHTAFTFAVPTLPAGVIVKGVGIGNKTIQDAAAASCRSAFDRFIGGSPASRALSRITMTYFLPSQAGFDLGAHWVRCDLIAMQTQTALGDVPTNPRHFLDQANALDAFGACSQGDPGSPSFRLVICSQPHTYRALAALRLGADTSKYPGDTVTRVEGKRHCAHVISSQLNRSGGYTYGWTYPTAANWAQGQRFGYCWNKTAQ